MKDIVYKEVMVMIEELSKITPNNKNKDLTIEMQGMTFHLAIDDLDRFMEKFTALASKFENKKNEESAFPIQ